jgi:hypothetical protein
MSVSNNEPIALVLRNTIERIYIYVVDADCNAVDATSLSLKVYDQYENLMLQDDFFNGYGNPPTPPTHIVKPASTTGQYYFPFGDTSFDTKNSTAIAQEYLFVWNVTGVVGSEAINVVQVAKVVSARTMRLVPKLRLIIDKAIKAIDDDPSDPVFTGYTDSMIVQFLEGGLDYLNAFPPTINWASLDTYPDIFLRTLLDAATVAALTSQELFAVDTDVVYSDNGQQFTIDHQPKLSAILNTTWARVGQIAPSMKKQLLNSGGIHVQVGPAFRFTQMLNSAPYGTLFRNSIIAGV